MAHLKNVMAGMLAGLVLAGLPLAAQAHRRCGFDRYGYLPPDFRGCGWPGPYSAGFFPAYAPGFPYVRAPVLDNPPPPNCYYDNGYDLRVRLVCRDWPPYLPD